MRIKETISKDEIWGLDVQTHSPEMLHRKFIKAGKENMHVDFRVSRVKLVSALCSVFSLEKDL